MYKSTDVVKSIFWITVESGKFITLHMFPLESNKINGMTVFSVGTAAKKTFTCVYIKLAYAT